MVETTLALYGHPLSSYTWKAQIALNVAEIDYDFRALDGEHPEYGQFLADQGGPWGLFPVLVDGEDVLFEASVIVEHLALTHASARGLVPADPAEALRIRMVDRVFDLYVMGPAQATVREHLRNAETPDPQRCAEARDSLEMSYAWIERWLAGHDLSGPTTLIECAAAPSLFYADWVQRIGPAYPRLQQWRANLLARPEVSRCVEAGRPYRKLFPLGAPDRD